MRASTQPRRLYVYAHRSDVVLRPCLACRLDQRVGSILCNRNSHHLDQGRDIQRNVQPITADEKPVVGCYQIGYEIQLQVVVSTHRASDRAIAWRSTGRYISSTDRVILRKLQQLGIAPEIGPTVTSPGPAPFATADRQCNNRGTASRRQIAGTQST